MIKIEFKEAVKLMSSIDSRILNVKILFNYPYGYRLRSKIKSVTFGCPSELVPSRSEVLTQLGITEQEDKLFQEQYKNV